MAAHCRAMVRRGQRTEMFLTGYLYDVNRVRNGQSLAFACNCELRVYTKRQISSMTIGLQYRRVRFGAFEADFSTCELFKRGIRIKIQDQPFQILATLLERPGELVLREELRKKLWEADTFVDFDAGLNAAVRRLRDALNDSRNEPRYIETVHRHGYRFLAPVEIVHQPLIPNLLETVHGKEHSASPAVQIKPTAKASDEGALEPRVSAWKWKVVVAAGVVVIVGATAIVWRLGVFTRHRADGIRSIAVLPLQNLSGDSSQDYFAEGMTDALITELGRLRPLRVISRTSVMQYKSSKKSLPEIAQELNVEAVVEGSVVRSGNRVRIDAQLIQASPERHLWANAYERDLADIVSLQDDVTRAIADEVQIKLTRQEQALLSRVRPVNPHAFNAYLLGQFFLDRAGKDNLEKALGYYGEAIQLDPNYARAWAGLADANRFLGGGGYAPAEEAAQKSRLAVERALELDPDLAEAHAAKGSIQMYVDWDWAAADASFARSLSLEPGNLSALRGAASLAKALGRFDQALQLARRAVERDPLNPRSYRLLGHIALSAGRLEEALAASKKAAELNPEGPITRIEIGSVYLAQSRPQEALAEMEQEKGPDWRSFGLALAYHALGRKKESEAALTKLIGKYGSTAAFQVAEVYGFRGEAGQAFEWLERAHAQRDGALIGIKGNPFLKSVEHDPRYGAFLQKMRLPN
jgi:TolB-like protein/DNA-binding winged helix-turn-helix (wHTH) protein